MWPRASLTTPRSPFCWLRALLLLLVASGHLASGSLLCESLSLFLAEFATWREAGHHYGTPRMRAVEESSTWEGDITTMTLEGPFTEEVKIVLSQSLSASAMASAYARGAKQRCVMVFFPHMCRCIDRDLHTP